MRALTLLIKPVSGSCNMRCRYCFYADVTDTRAVKNYGIMQEPLLETLVKNALAETSDYCTFAFQGGEPTLAGLDYFRKLIELEKKYNVSSVKIFHALQTNGLELNREWAEFFRENNFLIGLSIDASASVHNAMRTDAAGKGTHSRCIAAARLLKKYRVEFNILSVVTKQLAAHPDTAYNFYKRNGFKYIQFIPCLDSLDDERGQNDFSLNATAYGGFLCRIFDLWYADFVNYYYVSIRAFDNYIHMLAGRPAENCAMNGMCSACLLVEADGSAYPCDFYATDEYLLGNVADIRFGDMLSGEKMKAFIEPSRNVDPACRTCEYHFICRGGCRRDREPLIDNIPRLNRHCKAYKQFFAHALPRMTKIARQIG